jgi:hypothetical protein
MIFQAAAMIFVIGSYVLAEGMRKHRLSSVGRRLVKSTAES